MCFKTTIAGGAAAVLCVVGAKSCTKAPGIVARTGAGAIIATDALRPATRAFEHTGSITRTVTQGDDIAVMPHVGEDVVTTSDDAARSESWPTKIRKEAGKEAVQSIPDIAEQIGNSQDQREDRR